MKAAAEIKSKQPARKQAGTPDAVAKLPSNGLLLQRKVCPCGGGCPRCSDAAAKTDYTGMPESLKTSLETHTGFDLSGVRVYRNSPEPAKLNALAYTQGRNIHIGPGEERHLTHEAWHVVQQMQGRVRPGELRIGDTAINEDAGLESEADRMANRLSQSPDVAVPVTQSSPPSVSDSHSSSQPAQRQVRTGGGATKINEAPYLPGGAKSGVGTKYSVASLIGDSVRRVFTSTTELESYANGKTDYIGDVVTKAAGTFWYRLPKDKLTVLGEVHDNPNGNAEDVILGLGTSRFMYEGFNELADVAPFEQSKIGTSTKTRLASVHKGVRLAGAVDRGKFNPDLENIVIKALTGAAIARNEYIAAKPSKMSAAEQKKWSKRASTNDYSYGERVALYLSFAIHIARDIAAYSFGKKSRKESKYLKSARKLMENYNKNKTELDNFSGTKDSDDLIGIYELTSPGGFANLPAIKEFTLVFHEFGARYIEELGRDVKNKTLEAQGKALSRKRGATIKDLSPAREEIMWQRIQTALANKYLIVGMGDAHHRNLSTRLTTAKIDHAEAEQSLKDQKTDIDGKWVK